MRRVLVFSALVGLTLAGLGCKHVTGRCDCTYNPSDDVLPAAGNPYHPINNAGVVALPPAPTPTLMPTTDTEPMKGKIPSIDNGK
jgi:hypothetical protein